MSRAKRNEMHKSHDDDEKWWDESKGSDARWMQGAVKKPGALRKALHVKKGEKIPLSKLEKAAHSKNPLMKKRAILAETFRKYHG
jgi:hypothetical protein